MDATYKQPRSDVPVRAFTSFVVPHLRLCVNSTHPLGPPMAPLNCSLAMPATPQCSLKESSRFDISLIYNLFHLRLSIILHISTTSTVVHLDWNESSSLSVLQTSVCAGERVISLMFVKKGMWECCVLIITDSVVSRFFFHFATPADRSSPGSRHSGSDRNSFTTYLQVSEFLEFTVSRVAYPFIDNLTVKTWCYSSTDVMRDTTALACRRVAPSVSAGYALPSLT